MNPRNWELKIEILELIGLSEKESMESHVAWESKNIDPIRSENRRLDLWLHLCYAELLSFDLFAWTRVQMSGVLL